MGLSHFGVPTVSIFECSTREDCACIVGAVPSQMRIRSVRLHCVLLFVRTSDTASWLRSSSGQGAWLANFLGIIADLLGISVNYGLIGRRKSFDLPRDHPALGRICQCRVSFQFLGRICQRLTVPGVLRRARRYAFVEGSKVIRLNRRPVPDGCWFIVIVKNTGVRHRSLQFSLITPGAFSVICFQPHSLI